MRVRGRLGTSGVRERTVGRENKEEEEEKWEQDRDGHRGKELSRVREMCKSNGARRRIARD